MTTFTSFLLSILQNYGILKLSVFLLSAAFTYVLIHIILSFLENKGLLSIGSRYKQIVAIIFAISFGYIGIQLQETISVVSYLVSAFIYVSLLIMFVLMISLFTGAKVGGNKIISVIITIVLSLILIYIVWYVWKGSKAGEYTGPNLLLAPEVLYTIILLLVMGVFFILVERKYTK